MEKQKIFAPEWFFNMKDSRKIIKYLFNLSPNENYFELLSQPYIGIVVHDIHRYAYIVEFEDQTFKKFKFIDSLDTGENMVVIRNNVSNTITYIQNFEKKAS